MGALKVLPPYSLNLSPYAFLQLNDFILYSQHLQGCFQTAGVCIGNKHLPLVLHTYFCQQVVHALFVELFKYIV